ncbi:hypothetical protein B0T24DRAFT_592936 [Lasiosphaeria ovina]|uniref:Protein disulfide-isomerase n=1 Tax=Lasiosphaeria ovina TaxID=92902 RepID=A0AAE0KJU2_9PEZI|nr:hypothetical protein B0T24DRAFT_592936 [Lasiosphaeria ovina]
MRFFRPFFAVGVLLSGRTLAWDHVDDTGALKEALRSNEHTLVAENSQALEPEWTLLRQNEGEDDVVSVDCSATPKDCEELGVASFPAIRLYHHGGKLDRYRGPRKAASIAGYLRRALRPAVSRISGRNATSFTAADDLVFVGHFVASDATLRDRFTALAHKYRDRFSFAESSEPHPLQQQQHPRQSVVTCYNNPDGLQRSTAELASAAALDNFVRLCSTPLIPELTRRNELSFYQTGKSIVHYFTHDTAERDAYAAEMRPLAQKYDEYLHFTTTDAGEYADAAAAMGLPYGAGGLAVQNPNNGDVFPWPRDGRRGPVTAAAVEAFLVDIIQGAVKPWRPGSGTGQGKGGHDEL